MTQMTEIHNGNIRFFAVQYCNKTPKLPDDLKQIPIGKWDVSKVQ